MPLLNFNQPAAHTTNNSADDSTWTATQLRGLLTDAGIHIPINESIDLLHGIAKSHNGKAYTIDLNVDTSSTSQPYNMNARYLLTKPLFFGQLVFSKGSKGSDLEKKGKKLAILLNTMLEIYFERKDAFIIFSENGRMFQEFNKPTAGACTLLLKAEPQFNLPFNDANAASNLILNIYNTHFLIQYLSADTAVLMQFSSITDRLQAKTSISEKLSIQQGSPSNPVVIEPILSEERRSNSSRLYIELNRMHVPVGASVGSAPNFATSYRLAEIFAHTFVVKSEKQVAPRMVGNNSNYPNNQPYIPQYDPRYSEPMNAPTFFMTRPHVPTIQLPLQEYPQPIQSSLPPGATVSTPSRFKTHVNSKSLPDSKQKTRRGNIQAPDEALTTMNQMDIVENSTTYSPQF